MDTAVFCSHSIWIIAADTASIKWIVTTLLTGVGGDVDIAKSREGGIFGWWWGATIDESLEARWLAESLLAAGGIVVIRYALLAVREETRLYKSICLSDLRGRRTMAEAEGEAKRVVVANFE